ncbi:MAG TPA: GNAT family N-acetyltransferase [Terracidiphilus sp.]|nr:GNAT family N-acetyltransferase [Terracidiphilus sp.]
MSLSARASSTEEIAGWREMYRAEMKCQVVHDNMHFRPEWTESYLLESDDAIAGYGSVLIAGPWTGTRTLFEFYVMPQFRSLSFALFECLLATSRSDAMEIQSNDSLITVMFHTYARNVECESIVFADQLTTSLKVENAQVKQRPGAASEFDLEVNGEAVGNGGILYHYNRPYGDVFMEIAENHRLRGYGSYLTQELKRICYERGGIPAARCNRQNVHSRKTLQKAGFVPYSLILLGKL